MKNLKIFFASIALLFILSSCDESIKEIEKSETFTTIEMREILPRDTTLIVVYGDNETIYLMDKETQLIKYDLHGNKYNTTGILIVFLFGLLFGFLIGAIIFNNH